MALDCFCPLRHLCMHVEACLIDTLVALVTCWLLLLCCHDMVCGIWYVLKSTL